MALDLTLAVVVLIVATLVWKYFSKFQYRMPGPSRLPIIGVDHLLKPVHNQHLILQKWAQKYGPVLYMPSTSSHIVLLSDLEGIMDVTVKKGKQCAGRYTIRGKYGIEPAGILHSPEPDKAWKSCRKTAHQHLRQFADGMSKLENIISDVGEDMFLEISKIIGQPCDPDQIVFNTILNSITFLITGERSRTSDPIMERIRNYVPLRVRVFQIINRFHIKDLFSWLQLFGVKLWKDVDKFVTTEETLWNEMKQMNKENKDSESICKILLAHMTGDNYNERDAQQSALSLIFAGLITTWPTLYSTLNILAHHPQIQEKMYKEIKSVCTEGQLASLKERTQMPYCRAFVLEILRYATVLPFSVTHRALEDVTIKGYLIPKETTLQMNIYALHHDPDFWKNPEEFIPERFLTDEGDLVPADHPNRKHLMPFGAGPRVCVGENLALARLFMLITTLVQRLEIKPAPGNDVSLQEPKNYKYTGVLKTQPYQVIFEHRKAMNF